MSSPFDLGRFVQAQEPVYDTVLAELGAGRKQSHWMWFIFPQLRALGRSATAKHFGLEGLREAQAYWGHPLLGPRLRACAERVLAISGRSAHEIFGSPDDLKLRSCMTLFEAAAPGETVFGAVLDKYHAGRRDDTTLEMLDAGA